MMHSCEVGMGFGWSIHTGWETISNAISTGTRSTIRDAMDVSIAEFRSNRFIVALHPSLVHKIETRIAACTITTSECAILLYICRTLCSSITRRGDRGMRDGTHFYIVLVFIFFCRRWWLWWRNDEARTPAVADRGWLALSWCEEGAEIREEKVDFFATRYGIGGHPNYHCTPGTIRTRTREHICSGERMTAAGVCLARCGAGGATQQKNISLGRG